MENEKMWLLPDALKIKIVTILGEVKANVVFKTLVELNTLKEYNKENAIN